MNQDLDQAMDKLYLRHLYMGARRAGMRAIEAWVYAQRLMTIWGY